MLFSPLTSSLFVVKMKVNNTFLQCCYEESGGYYMENNKV